MTRRIVERQWENRNLCLEKGDLLLLLEEPTKPLITARTRHGRNIKIPLSILARDNVHFTCQLCPNGPFRDYAAYTAHLIEEHFREQLMAGLDFTSGKGGMPSCPFPVCSGTLWASLQALLMHYASHHHVLEKLMMYESELQCEKYRSIIEGKEDQVDMLKLRITRLEQQLQEQKEQAAKSKEIGMREGMDIEVITGIGSNKEDIKPDLKKLIKYESETVTNIENKTLKKEYLQIKREKEKVENVLSQRTEEVEKLNSTMKMKQEELEAELKNAVENGRKWKETCLQEEERYTSENKHLKDELAESLREIENLKNIIEIGKSTVENAKLLATELEKDNRKRQTNEQNYISELKKYQEDCKIFEGRLQQSQQEIMSLRDLVGYQSEKLSVKNKDYDEISNSFEDLSAKYKSLLEILKRKDVDIESLRNNMESCAVEAQAMNTTIEESFKNWQTEKQAMQQEFRKELEIVSTMLKDKSQNIKQLQDEVSIVRVKLEEAKKEARNLTVQVMDWKEKYEDAQQQVINKEKIIQDTEAKLADKTKSVGEWKQKADAKQAEIDTTKKCHNLTLSQLQTDHTSLVMELELAKVNRGELESKLADIANNLEQAKAKLNSKSRNEEEFRKRCEKMSAELKVQGWEIDNYKRRLINSEIMLSSYGGLPGSSHSGAEESLLLANSMLAGKMANFSPPRLHHHASSSSSTSSLVPAPHSLPRDLQKLHSSIVAQDFLVPSLGSCHQSVSQSDPAYLAAEQEEYSENNMNTQMGERLLEPGDLKQEINITEEKEPTQEFREFNLKRSNSESSLEAMDSKKKKK